MTTTTRVDNLRAILAKRTPGRWRNGIGGQVFGVWQHAGRQPADAELVGEASTFDAAAIVAAVNAIGPALDVVEAARALTNAIAGCRAASAEVIDGKGAVAGFEEGDAGLDTALTWMTLAEADLDIALAAFDAAVSDA